MKQNGHVACSGAQDQGFVNIQSSSDSPVIAAGLSSPINASSVGAISASPPSRRLISPSPTSLAETEKYPHVTFFLNGGDEDCRTGETHRLVPSPQVATYDQQPEMSAEDVRKQLVDAIETGAHDLIICNFANPDMVGHTGDLDAAIKVSLIFSQVVIRRSLQQAYPAPSTPAVSGQYRPAHHHAG